MRKPLLPFFPLIALLSSPLHGEEIQGAEAVLRRLKDPTAQDQPKDASDVLKARLEAYRTGAAAMAPDKAATEWIQLLDSYLSMSPQSRMASYNSPSRISAGSVMEVLPPTSSWDALAAELQQRSAGDNTRQAALRNFLGSLLAADPAARVPALTRLKETIAADATVETYQREQLDENMGRLEQLVSPSGAPAADPVARLSKQLDDLAARRSVGYRNVEIPRLPDTPAAREVLVRYLKTDATGRFEDEETQQLFIRIAKEQLPNLPEPPWNLIRSLRDVPLFEAAAKLRPEAAKTLAETDEMRSMFLSHHLQEGEEAEAMAIIGNPRLGKMVSDYFSMGRIQHNSRTNTLDGKAEKLLLELETRALGSDPNLPYWQSVLWLAPKYGQSGEFSKSVEAALVDPRLTSPRTRQEVEDIHLTLLLNDGKVDEGVKFLDDLLAKSEKPVEQTNESPPEGILPDAGPPDTSSRREQLLIRAIRLGRLLDRPALLDRALDEYSKLLPVMASMPYDSEIWTNYIERNRGALLEKALSDRMARLAASPDEGYGMRDIERPLVRLAWLYDQLGRHEDVIRLLDEGPFWSAPDLAELRRESISAREVLLIAAKAMNATGRRDKALEIIRQLIRFHPGDDEGYLLLSQLNPPDQMDFLEEIAASDRFQERPLIWQAKLLLTQGKTEEAESTVKKAIAIDPSDGEQGKGDRMRAYEVLADILEKKGDAEQTKFFRNVVAAIRLSETADDWWTATMTRKAIEIYEQSLRSFADAYCIQSRLALRYASEDNMEKATQYYQRAFELMPDSFGRVESHCFGCEGAFTGKVAQSIAEKVFTGLAEKPDAKPQVFYLLGYLRESQGRSAEAKEFFRKTVEMDPDYVNAWAKLGELAQTVEMAPEERDEIAFSLFRLKSEPALLSGASDLRKVWDALLEAEKNSPPPVNNLYPLVAAKEQLAKQKNDRSQYYSYLHSRDDNPRATLTQNPLISGLTVFLEASVSVD